MGGVKMLNYLKLDSKILTLDFNELPQFKTTKDIPAYKNIIGQKRAAESIDIGLLMDKKEYNIYISGPSGTGKTSYIINKIKDYAKTLPDPCDWCYVYNFKDSYKPLAIPLPTGTAPKFKETLKNFINDLFKKVPSSFDSENYEAKKRKILEKYEKLLLERTNLIHEEANKKNFAVTNDGNGNFVFIPLNSGKKMDIEVYNTLSSEEKNSINDTSNELRILSSGIVKEMNNINKQMLEDLKNLDDKISKSIMSKQINKFKKEYGPSEKVINYLDLLELDIIQNIDAFLEEDDTANTTAEEDETNPEANLQQSLMAALKFPKNFFRRYEVKVLVTNQVGEGAPVVYEDSPDYNNIFGRIEYENVVGNTITDFTMIRPGKMHSANGGFLVVSAEQLLSNPNSWRALKKCLKSQMLFIKNSKGNMEFFPIITLTPESIPLKVKIILVGSSYTYYLLSYNDYDFDKLFRIKAEFDSEIEISKSNMENTLGFISSYIQDNNLLYIDRDGIKELFRYSCRLAESRNYFTASMNELLKVIDMANVFAKKEHSSIVNQKHIDNALHELYSMHGLIKTRTLRMYKEGKYIVDLKGSKIGEINGLSVMDFGDCTIGQQHRITVTTCAGKAGVTNIEREANMSGSIHSKGIMILSGFISEFIGQHSSLSFNAKIAFEQLYSGIDGDSASAAELLALISNLSNIPIKQGFAITGSVNQKGEIQPIGGVNDKIEGYFDICNIYGLDGSHGVLIPHSNVDDLILDNKVLDALEKELFHIYSVKNIEDCIELLFDFDGLNKKNIPTMEFIKDRIIAKIEKYKGFLRKK